MLRKIINVTLPVLVILVTSCDIVREPYLEEIKGENTSIRKVLLEEFTGQQCPNCPEGDATAVRLQAFYGNKLIIVSYHSGFFARTSGTFPIDYRTSEGNELDVFFGVQFYPSGMVNRTVERKARLLGQLDWGEAISGEMRKSPEVTIQLSTVYNASSRVLNVEARVKMLKETNSRTRICIFLTEDSLVSAQSVSGNPLYPQGIIAEYIHRHIFRFSMNGTWGEPLFDTGALSLSEKRLNYSSILDTRYNAGNAHLVAFVYKESDKTILQSESVKVFQ